MLILTDRAAIARALTTPIDPAVRRLLHLRIDLADDACFYISEPGDRLIDIDRALGFPLLHGIDADDPIPIWEWIIDHGGCLEVCCQLGDGLSHVLVIPDHSAPDHLIGLLRESAMPPPASAPVAG